MSIDSRLEGAAMAAPNDARRPAAMLDAQAERCRKLLRLRALKRELRTLRGELPKTHLFAVLRQARHG